MSNESKDMDFDESPTGWARRWEVEIPAAKKAFEKWHQTGDKIVKLFRNEKENGDEGKRLGLFTSNVTTQLSMMYGNVPKSDVSRRFADAADDVARVASEMLERLINTDIEEGSDSYCEALENCLKDRLTPGGAFDRLRYVAEFEEVPEKPAQLDGAGMELAPAVPATERKTFENVEVDYVHWKDILWNEDARTWDEVRWLAFRVEMSRKQLVKRFGKQVGNAVPLNAKRKDDDKKATPWSRAEVFEIWDDESRKVFWFVQGFGQVLDEKDDPLGLDNFWPCPKPWLANTLTDKLLPRPDYALAQDLYMEADEVTTRIKLLTDALAVKGVYDKRNGEMSKLLQNDKQNILIPVDNWAMFAEKGGLKGAIDWFPLEQVVATVASLREHRSDTMNLLFQVTGMSDIMRGQATSGGVTATEQSIKAKFGSVRMQKLQDEFARFASDTLRLKAEIIAKHFDPQTILERCNCKFNEADAPHVPAAIDLIKSSFSKFRIEVKPESISLTDFAALKDERVEMMQGVAQFMTAAAPLAAQSPAIAPHLMKMLQWFVAGLRGSSTMEGILDGAIQAAEQQAQQPQQQQPDPKLMAQQMKGAQDLQKVKAELEADLVRLQAETQASAAQEQQQMQWNVQEHAAKQQISAALKPPEVPKFGGKP